MDETHIFLTYITSSKFDLIMNLILTISLSVLYFNLITSLIHWIVYLLPVTCDE